MRRNPHRTRRRHLLRSLLFALVVVGCGDATAVSANDPVGTWTLATINGALPLTIVSGSQSVTITGSVLTIAANGTYNEVLSFKQTSGATTVSATHTELGTWTASSGAVTFSDQTDGVTYQGSVSGNTLTEINNGYTQVYHR